MRGPVLLVLLGLSVAAGGCDQLPVVGKKKAPPPPRTAAQPGRDTVEPQPSAAPAPAAAPRRPLVDQPWTPRDTGTIAPGMSRAQVIATWGVPVAERTVGERTYLYFRNGCEVSCGTFDVVFLENGQVVDAIVRGPGHGYAGSSSSPPGRKAEVTRPPGEPGAGVQGEES